MQVEVVLLMRFISSVGSQIADRHDAGEQYTGDRPYYPGYVPIVGPEAPSQVNRCGNKPVNSTYGFGEFVFLLSIFRKVTFFQ